MKKGLCLSCPYYSCGEVNNYKKRKEIIVDMLKWMLSWFADIRDTFGKILSLQHAFLFWEADVTNKLTVAQFS